MPGAQISCDLSITNGSGFQQDISFLLPVGDVNVNHPTGPDSYGYYFYDDSDTQFSLAPVYDFTNHRRTSEFVEVGPAPIIMVEGILIFTKRKLRDLMDIKIFVDTDADVRFIRRLTRDMQERGRSLDSIVSQYLDTGALEVSEM